MTDARIMALRLAGKICPAWGHVPGPAQCNDCEKIADVLEQYSNEQNGELRSEIRDLKDIGRAKAKMAGEMGFTEPEAHRYLQKTAMDNRRSMGDLARDILRGPTNHNHHCTGKCFPRP